MPNILAKKFWFIYLNIYTIYFPLVFLTTYREAGMTTWQQCRLRRDGQPLSLHLLLLKNPFFQQSIFVGIHQISSD